MALDPWRFTILDWAVIALVIGVAMQGARMGFVNFLLVGRARALLALALAPAVLSWGMVQYGGARQLASSLAIPLGWATTVGTLASTVIVFMVLGLFGHVFSAIAGVGTAGWSLNRLLGLFTGAFVGTWIAIFAIVGPSLAAKDYVRPERQPLALRLSILVPWVNTYIRPRVDQVITSISRR